VRTPAADTSADEHLLAVRAHHIQHVARPDDDASRRGRQLVGAFAL